MAIDWKIEAGNLIVFEVSGQLGKAEHQQIMTEIESVIQKLGRIKILVLLNDFGGWESASDWEETSTDKIDPFIDKFAIVGDEQWRELAEVFTLKGLRPVPIEYFDTSQKQAAQQWLDT